MTDPPLPYPVDDEDTDRITVKFAARLTGDSLDGSTDGLRIDRYINAEVRARGGMGRVFVAYDPGLDRTVALKALPVGLLPHEPDADMPRREGMALAHIDHPNVVRVLELVEHRGLTCLVLEHIDGPHLGDWLKAPRDTHDILGKFLQAGEGLAAVHRTGLVHRDFKPANAVVGPGGVVKLIDFGLAVRPSSRPLDDADERPGTPRYMAPEQIDGRPVDARSDQFNFCVALYEALFHEHPYLSGEHTPSGEQSRNAFDADAEEASRRTIFSEILEGTPRRPKRAPPGLSPTVVPALLRGLSPAPEARHASMDVLLAELRRDPRRSRRRAFFGISGALALTASLYCALHPERCPSEEEEAKQTWGGLREVVAARVAPLGPGSIDDLDRAVDQLAKAKNRSCNARGGGDAELIRGACLQARENELQALFREIQASDTPKVARLLNNLRKLPPATSCEDVVRLRFNCVENGVSQQARLEGSVALLAGDHDSAIAWANSALNSAEVGGSAGSQAHAHALVGRIAYERGDRPRALHHLTRAVELAEHNACFAAAADAYYWFVKLAAFDELIPLSRAETYSQYHEYRLADHDRPGLAAVLNNRALLAERRSNNLPLAEQLLHSAIALRHGAVDASTAQADSYLNLSSVLYKAGRHDEALAALDKADEQRRRAVGPDHHDHGKHLHNRGLIELALGRPRQALVFLEQALTRAQAGLGSDAPHLGEYYTALAKVHDTLGDREASLRAAESAANSYSDGLQRSERLEDLAQQLIADGRYAEALPLLDTAERLMSAPDVPPERLGIIYFRRGEALNGLGSHGEAEQYARRSLLRFDDIGLGPNNDLRAHAGLILGEALVGQSRWHDAAAPFKKAVTIWRASGDNPERLAWAWSGLAHSLCQLPDRPLEAQRAAREAGRAISLIESTGDRHALEQQLAETCRLQ